MFHPLPWLLGTLALAAAARSQDVAPPERFAAARAAIAAEVDRGLTPALSVAVLEAGEVVWAEGFGVADLERGTPATADTIYRLASISKPFTATAAMRLVERGALDLDAPVNGYLAGRGVIAYRGRPAQITLRRLMNHTAGLPTHWSFFYTGSVPPPRDETVRRYGFAAWEPGTRTNYSNLAFGIVDHVIARTSGRSYRDFLVEEILDPSGMSATDVGVRPGREADAAVGYVRDVSGRFVPVVDYGFDHDGASAVRSSARDLMRFARLQIDDGAVDGARVLEAETVRAMRLPRGRDAGSGFGIAWGVGLTRGVPSLRHTGGMPGVSTVLQVLPESGAALAVLTNTSERGPVNRSLDAILDVLLGPDAAAESAARAPVESAPPSPGAWRGAIEHFDGPIPMALSIDDHGGVALSVSGESARSFRVLELAATRLRVSFEALLRTTPAFHGTPRLELELERDDGGWSGVLYAVGDGTFRLPHRVELAPEAGKPDGTLRVVSYNVLVGFQDYGVGDPYLPGVQRRIGVAKWLAAQQADVVAFQEMNGYTDARLRREAAAWGHAHAVVLKEDGYPVALTSRWPIEVVARMREGLHHGFLHCRTAGIDFVVVHVVPSPGVPRKLRELEPVVAAYRAALEAGRPIVLLGDFNAIAEADVDHYAAAAVERYRKWNYAFDGDRPSETAITPVLDAGATDLWLAKRPDAVTLPLPRIDFVFASPDLVERCTGCEWLALPPLLERSDHPPVVADFRWTPR